MSTGELVGYGATFLTGAASGGLAGWFGRPGAQAKADARRTERAEQRELITSARALVVEANREEWQPEQVRADGRYQDIARHLPADVRGYFDSLPARIYTVPPDGGQMYRELTRGIDEVANRWKLP